MAGVILIILVFVVLLVKSTISEENAKKRQTHSVFIKILMNHMQMIFIASQFNMRWPPEILDFFNNISILVEAQKMLVAFDCWMDTREWLEHN